MGDASPIGWAITVAYFLTAVGCAGAWRISCIGAEMSRTDRPIERRRRARTSAYRASSAFWALLLVATLVLGTNKQLDLHEQITRLGRRFASEQGWYGERQAVQAWLVGGVLALGAVALVVLLLGTRELLPRHALAFGGAMVLGTFVALRMLSFHQLDAWLFRPVLGIEVRAGIEAAGIAAIAVCAWLNARWYGRRRSARD